MLEKVIVSLEKEAAEDKIKELRENLALYQTELLVDTGFFGGNGTFWNDSGDGCTTL